MIATVVPVAGDQVVVSSEQGVFTCFGGGSSPEQEAAAAVRFWLG